MQSEVRYKGRKIDIDGPILGLPRDILNPLCVHLSHDSSVDVEGLGGDWKDLAGYIGFPADAIELINSFRDRLKPLTLFKIWDSGIAKNPGTVRKLFIALFEAGFGKSFLKTDLLTPLMDISSVDAVEAYITSLKCSLKEPIFPCLELNDIIWDEEMDYHPATRITQSPSTETCCSTYSDGWQRTQPHDSHIYISYYTKSRSRTYIQEVRRMAEFFGSYGYTVRYDSNRHEQIDKGVREQWIHSSANIVVVFNKEYRNAHEAFINNEVIPSCLVVDIPLICHIFNNVPNGRQRILPVVIDRCKTQPSLATFPVYLTGSTRRFFPSNRDDLLACIQKVPLRVVVPSPGRVRMLKQNFINGDDIRRRYKESKTS